MPRNLLLCPPRPPRHDTRSPPCHTHDRAPPRPACTLALRRARSHSGHGYCHATDSGRCRHCYFTTECTPSCELAFFRCLLDTPGSAADACAACHTELAQGGGALGDACAAGCSLSDGMRCDAAPPSPSTAASAGRRLALLPDKDGPFTCSAACEAAYVQCVQGSDCDTCKSELSTNWGPLSEVCEAGCMLTDAMHSTCDTCSLACQAEFGACVEGGAGCAQCRADLTNGLGVVGERCDSGCRPTASMECAQCSPECEGEFLSCLDAGRGCSTCSGELMAGVGRLGAACVPGCTTTAAMRCEPKCSAPCERSFLKCMLDGPGCAVCRDELARRSAPFGALCVAGCTPTAAMNCHRPSGGDLCLDHGMPQGGPLPWDPTWAAGNCPASNMTGGLPARPPSSCDLAETSGASVELVLGADPLHHAHLAPASREDEIALASANHGARFNSAMCVDASRYPLTLRVDGTPRSAAEFSALRELPTCGPASSETAAAAGMLASTIPSPSTQLCGSRQQHSSLFSARPLRTRWPPTSCAELRTAWRAAASAQPVASAAYCDRQLDASKFVDGLEALMSTVCDAQLAASAAFTGDVAAVRLVHTFDAGGYAGATAKFRLSATNAAMACVVLDGAEDTPLAAPPGDASRARAWEVEVGSLSRGAHHIDVILLGRAAAPPPALHIRAPASAAVATCTSFLGLPSSL